METNYISVLGGFLIVLGLMGVTLFLLKKLVGRVNTGFTKGLRLNIVEVRYLDPKRKLILIKRDDKEHLLLVGGSSDIVIEKDIANPGFEFRKEIIASENDIPT